jgi:hypothetical protein
MPSCEKNAMTPLALASSGFQERRPAAGRVIVDLHKRSALLRLPPVAIPRISRAWLRLPQAFEGVDHRDAMSQSPALVHCPLQVHRRH